MSNRRILITGATGFLGADIMKRILSDNKDDTVYAIARGKNGKSAQKRIEEIINGQKRVEIFEGDISEDNLGLGNKQFNRLADEIDEIYHCAAMTDLIYPIEKIRKVNVKGTENILNLALKAKKLKRVFHISTAYIVGTKKCLFKENDLNVGQSFNNSYEQSKYEAELLVDVYRKKGLNITVFRPSIITGDSNTGKTNNFMGFYRLLHLLNEEIFDAIPASENSFYNLVPIDMVTEGICLIANDKESKDKTYHITHPNDVNFNHFVSTASDYFWFKKPSYLPLDDFDINSLTPVQRKIIEPYIPYFNYETKFDNSNADKIFKKHNFSFPDYDKERLNRIFEYCLTSGFIKRKKRAYA